MESRKRALLRAEAARRRRIIASFKIDEEKSGSMQWCEEGSVLYASLLADGYERSIRKRVQDCFWAVLMVRFDGDRV